MSDLIDEYARKGLISDPTRNFRCCECCGKRVHPDDLNDVDTEEHGDHTTLEICDGCMPDEKAAR
jgi:hypothetical protein